MPDIRICHELPAKAEVYEIASHLDLDVNATIGVLVRVWIWADQHTSDGWSMHSPKLLESIIGVSGLIQALESVGWIELPGSGFRFPGLHRYTGDGRTTKSRRNKARAESKEKPRGENGRFRPKNPASTSTTEGAGTSPGPDRTRTRTRTVPEPNRTTEKLTSGEKFLASRDERVEAILAPWKEAKLIGSPEKAREAVYRALVENEADTLLDASKLYLGSQAAQERQYTCRAHTFFNEQRFLLDPAEWEREEKATGWSGLKVSDG
jgi:hypothetical protein